MQTLVKSIPYYDEKGFDTYLYDLMAKNFGVFDGMGTSDDARKASEIMRKGFARYSLTPSAMNFDMLKYVIEVLQKDVSVNASAAGTTATVIHIDEFGSIQYAHVGDSRLYILYEGRIKQVTADEGYGNVLYNYVGQNGKGVCQLGQIDDWDGFILCSDGVTGDWPDQFIKDQEIEEILNNAYSIVDKADQIIAKSKKNDDKTLIIAIK